MAQKKSDSLTIVVNGNDAYLPVHSVLRLIVRTIKILHEIEDNISVANPGPRVTWRVSEATMNSPLKLTIYGEPTNRTRDVRRVVRTYLSGIAMIEETPSLPPHFTDASLRTAQRLSESLENGIRAVTFSSPGKTSVSPTQKVAEHVSDLLSTRPSEFFETASIEGTAQMVELFPTLKIKIYGPQSPQGLVCAFSQKDRKAVERAIGKRVEVSGRLRSDKDGRPVGMSARSIRMLRSDSSLPTFRDLEGIDITGGVDPTDYVRRLRDEK